MQYAAEQIADTTRIYDGYRALYRVVIEGYRRKIVEADPRICERMAHHLASNWGNDAAQEMQKRCQRVSRYVLERRRREYERADRQRRES